MKRAFNVALICLLAGVVIFLLLPPKQRVATQNPSVPPVGSPTATPLPNTPAVSSSSPTPSESNPPGAAGLSSASQQNLAARAGERVADTNAAANLPPEVLLQNVRRAVRLYGEMFGGNPVGTNPEITAALAGKNPKQINFLAGQAGMSVNGNGELVDTWGTPYFFHQLSGSDMEIHSAGPDKIMWTSDDLVTR